MVLDCSDNLGHGIGEHGSAPAKSSKNKRHGRYHPFLEAVQAIFDSPITSL